MSKRFAPQPLSSSQGDLYGGYISPTNSSTNTFQRCYHTHPKLLLGGGEFYGGSCFDPVCRTADVYIGFDHGMKVVSTFPPTKRVDQIHFPIPDMGVPKDAKGFADLVDWTVNVLKSGDTVHAGCIGGHGRTGMFLSALMARLGTKDAIQKARELYCQKAVESAVQVKFLMEHFGVSEAPGYKDFSPSKGGGSVKVVDPSTSQKSKFNFPKSSGGKEFGGKNNYQAPPKPQGTPFANSTAVWASVQSSQSIWKTLL